MTDTRRQVLLASTSADLRQRIGKLLGQAQGHAFQLTEADTAFRALEIAAKGKMSCILVDFAALDQTPEAFLSALTGAGSQPAVLALVDRAEASAWTSSPHDRGVQGVLTRDETDERILAYGIMCAIQQKQSERMVYEQMLLVKAILTGAPGLLALKNASLEYQAANAAFCQFLGKGQEEIAGRTDFDLFPAEYAEAYRREDQRVMRSFVPRVDDLEVVGADGPRWMSISRSPIFDPDGETAGILLFASDITELKEMARTAQEAEARISAARDESHAKVDDLESQIAEASRQLAALRAELESVRNAGSAASSQMAELLASLESERAASGAAKEAAAAAQNELATLNERLAGLQREVATLLQEREQTSQALATCEQRIADAGSQAGAAEGQLAAANTRIAELESTIADTRSHADASAEKLSELESERDAAQESRAAFERERDDLTARCADAESQLSELREQMENTAQSITLLNEEKSVMESTLTMREEAYQAAFDAAICALCEVGVGTRVMNANPAALEVLECENAEIESGSLNLIDLVHPDARIETADYLKTCLGESAVPARRIAMLTRKGKPFTGLVKCAVLRHGAKPTGLIVSIMDVSAETKLNVLRELAEQAETLAGALRKASE